MRFTNKNIFDVGALFPPPHHVRGRIKKYCNDTKDPLVPSVWGKLDDRDNHYKDKKGGCNIL